MTTPSSSSLEFVAELLAPENFAMVTKGVYRSAFPRSKNLTFLKSLGLKTVIPLVPEEIPNLLKEFYFANNINLISGLGLDGNKWPFKELQFNQVCVILQAALDPANQPVLIHCNKGKHRTGSIVGCIRRIQNWSLSAAVNEYIMFAAPKTRLEDQRFIESFDSDEFKNKYNNCPDH